jgi:hypothetical protein
MGKRILGAIVLSGLWLAAPAAHSTEQVPLQPAEGRRRLRGRPAKCESGAAKGEAVDQCLAKAAEKAGRSAGQAEGKEDCIVTAPDAAVDAVVDEFVQQLLDTLNPPPVICCAVPGSTCLFTTDAAACMASPLSGTPGAEGSVCTGDGSCSAPPASPGNCCQDFSAGGVDIDCANGTFDATACSMAGGTFSTAICTPSGLCQ